MPPPELPTGQAVRARTRDRLRTGLTRPGRGQVLAGALLFVVGLAGVTQVQMKNADSAYTNARREDLVLLLDGLDADARRLQAEIAELDRTRTSLQSGADTSRVARSEAESRAAELAILTGTVPAQGPGIRMRIADPRGLVTADLLLDAVEEMRDAGAEVIELNDRVRVVASTWFGPGPRGLLVDGVPLRPPYTVEVIGEPHALEEAAQFRGGIVSEITGPRIGGSVQITRPAQVVVESLHPSRDNQYAQPAPPSPTPR